MTCLSMCYGFILWLGGTIALAIAESRAAKVLLVAALIASVSPAEAQKPLPDPIAAGSIFTEQCDWVSAAYLRTGTVDRWQQLDRDVLMTLEYTPASWQGYDSPAPFERVQQPGGAFWHIMLLTPCGVKISQVIENTDGSFRIDAFRTMELRDQQMRPCQIGDGSAYCGYHDFAFGHIDADEWARITQP